MIAVSVTVPEHPDWQLSSSEALVPRTRTPPTLRLTASTADPISVTAAAPA
jgi:hypothetical protein